MKRIKVMTEIAIGISMAVVCSFIKLWEMPQGGAVSLVMIPIFVVAMRCGVFAGCMVGGVYGLLAVLLSGVIYHPASILLDYILAFSLLGIAGFFRKNLVRSIVGIFLGTLARFISSVISGAVIFASFAPVGQNPWIYSVCYQATYMLPEMIITIIAFIFLYTNNFLKGKREI